MADGKTPTIRELVPPMGTVGSKVTIMGHDFGTKGGVVSFNGVQAEGAVAEAKLARGEAKPKDGPVVTPEGWSDTAIGVVVPEGATAGDVRVHVDGVMSNGSHYTVTVLPVDAEVGQAGLTPAKKALTDVEARRVSERAAADSKVDK